MLCRPQIHAVFVSQLSYAENPDTLYSQLIAATTMHDVLYSMGKDLPWSLSVEQSDFAILISEEQQCPVVCRFASII